MALPIVAMLLRVLILTFGTGVYFQNGGLAITMCLAYVTVEVKS